MTRKIALSTCWCSDRHQDGYEMLEEMVSLGFEYVELSHGIRITLVPGILRAVKEGTVKISSTHNFCPLPPGIIRPAPNLYAPSAPDPREFQQWLRHTRRSIEFASQVGAPFLVAHMGRIPFFWFCPSRTIKKHLRKSSIKDFAALTEDTAFQQILARAFRRVRGKMPPYWEQLRASIEEILTDAERCRVTIGAENRESFEELPLDADFPEFFKQARNHERIGLWHDVGHARIKEQMGIINHRKFLDDNRAKLLGFHLHDVNAQGRDHQPLGTGTVDFRMIRDFIEPRHALVLELSPRVNSQEVADSKKYLEDLVGGAEKNP